MSDDIRESKENRAPAAARLWDLLTEPAATVTGSTPRRRARFLAAILLGLIALRVVGLVAYVPRLPADVAGVLALMVILLVAYVLSRTRFFRLGALIVVWSLLALTLSTLFVAPALNAEIVMARTSWVVLPLLIGTALVPPRDMVLPIILYGVALAILPLILPGLQYAHLISALAFFASAALMSLLVYQQLTQVEAERINFLKRERSSLEARFEARTRELADLNAELSRQIRLHRDLLEAANSLLIQLDIKTLLQQLAEAAHAVLGYELVVVNMVEGEGEEVRVAAHVGLSPGNAKIPTAAAVPMTWAELLNTLEERHRRGQKTYFLPGDGSDGAGAAGPWDPRDVLIALITLSSNESVGLVSVDRPLNGRRPATETIQALDLFANLAGIAIQNSRNFAAVQRELAERRRAERILTEAHGTLKEKTEALNRSNEELHTLLYVISHDLKEPLRAIRSFARILENRHADSLNPQGRDYLRRVGRAGDRLHALLEDILTLSRVDAAASPVECTDSRAIVNDVLIELAAEILETGATINIHGELPQLYVNRSWATRAVQNLVANALKYARNGAPPAIDIEPVFHTDTSGLAIMDRGPGVSAGIEETIFDLFRRGVDQNIEGTGAGLAIARRIARQNGGEAWYESRPGGGAIFKITFRNRPSEPLRAQSSVHDPEGG